jgi:Skp family chaperone for outer membrane proteins
LGFAGYIAAVVSAQSSASAPPRPYQVAVVDIAQLIKNHPGFIAKQKDLQEFAKSKESEFNTRKMELVEREKTLTSLKLTPGTPDYDKAMEEVTSKVALLDKDVKIAQRKLMTENSIILHEVYKEIRDEIGLVAKQAQIAQVMDYRTIDANPADPNAVATMLEQNLIWYDDNLDISQAIANRLYAKRKLDAKTVPNIKLARERDKQEAISRNDPQTRANTTPTTTFGSAGTTGAPTAPARLK